MTSTTDSPGWSRAFLPIAAIALTGLLLFAYFRKADDEAADAGPDDGLSYEQRVTPLVTESAEVAAQLASTNSLAAGLSAATGLRSRWQEARTAAGYDRARHDGFILTFNQFFNLLQSVEVIAAVLDVTPVGTASIPDARRMETMFALQGVHGAETGAQLVAKTGLPMEALLSRTNLAREYEAGVRAAIAQQVKVRQLLDQLAPPGSL